MCPVSLSHATQQMGLNALKPLVEELSRIGKAYGNLREDLANSLFETDLRSPVDGVIQGLGRRSYNISASAYTEITEPKAAQTQALMAGKARGKNGKDGGEGGGPGSDSGGAPGSSSGGGPAFGKYAASI